MCCLQERSGPGGSALHNTSSPGTRGLAASRRFTRQHGGPVGQEASPCPALQDDRSGGRPVPVSPQGPCQPEAHNRKKQPTSEKTSHETYMLVCAIPTPCFLPALTQRKGCPGDQRTPVCTLLNHRMPAHSNASRKFVTNNQTTFGQLDIKHARSKHRTKT